MELIAPADAYLESYRDALRRGWSSVEAEEDEAAAAAELADIDADPALYIERMNHPTELGRPVLLPDGSTVPRIPGLRRWMWDGDYCGAISLRWQPGTMDLPEGCLGHIGYAVVPWKRRRGYATAALGQMLTLARDRGLPHVDIVTDLDNVVSQAVVRANGGLLEEEFVTPPATGSHPARLWRVLLNPGYPPPT